MGIERVGGTATGLSESVGSLVPPQRVTVGWGSERAAPGMEVLSPLLPAEGTWPGAESRIVSPKVTARDKEVPSVRIAYLIF